MSSFYFFYWIVAKSPTTNEEFMGTCLFFKYYFIDLIIFNFPLFVQQIVSASLNDDLLSTQIDVKKIIYHLITNVIAIKERCATVINSHKTTTVIS